MEEAASVNFEEALIVPAVGEYLNTPRFHWYISLTAPVKPKLLCLVVPRIVPEAGSELCLPRFHL